MCEVGGASKKSRFFLLLGKLAAGKEILSFVNGSLLF